MDNSFVQNFRIDDFSLDDLMSPGKIIVPTFQRGVVWSMSHKKEFIETVKKGDPFGIVLAFEDKSKPNKFRLIDGLQRLSTLKAYIKNPLEFVDVKKIISNDIVSNLFHEKYKIKGLPLPEEKKLATEKRKFLTNFINLLKSKKELPSFTDIWLDVHSFLGVEENSPFSLISEFQKFYDAFIKDLELPPGIKIPVMFYNGDEENLPAVFSTLNTSSVSLTKYEIFASKWSTNTILISDDELITKVWSKYENLKNISSFEVAITEDDIRNSGMTLFEYCFAVSELLCDPSKEYDFLFPKSKKSTDPTGFELLALICGLSINKADELYKDEYLGKATADFLQKIKKALFDSVNIVSACLRDWVKDLRGNTIRNASSYQVYFMIMSVFNHKYHLNLEKQTIEQKTDKRWINGFQQNAYKWYYYHQLIDFWNAHRQVSDLKNAIEGKISDCDYSKSISAEAWKDAFDILLDADRSDLITRTVPSEIKFFLNYYYKLLILEDANRKKYFENKKDGTATISFDIEHIVPFNKFEQFKGKIPMTVLGNLCYLAVKDNRSKGDKTIYDSKEGRPSFILNKDFLEFIDYPSKKQLSFIDCSIEQFKKPYEEFVSTREKRMVDKFITLITK
ncbi:MAG: DUF262 domain-containing protein [Treponema sp.]|nr:DUF262 domain-containing protein [Treponema sp.]